MVASKREEMDREIDHVLITQSENLRRYWEVSTPLLDLVGCGCQNFIKSALYHSGGLTDNEHGSA